MEGYTILTLANIFPLQKSSNDVRVGVIHNPSTAPDKELHWLARAVYAVQETQNRNYAKNFITKLLKENNYDSISKGSAKVQDFEVNVSIEILCLFKEFICKTRQVH